MPTTRQHHFYTAHRCLNWIAGSGGLSWFLLLIRVISGLSLWAAGMFLVLIRVSDPDGQELNLWWRQALAEVHANRFLIVSVLLGVQIVCQALRWMMSRWMLFDVGKLQRILDHVLTLHFENQDRANHVYRATLFKVRRCWYFGWWLGIVARSGPLYPQKSAIFCVDARTTKHNTGIVGECWRRQGQTIIMELPNVREGAAHTEADLESFKAGGFLDDREYAAMNVRSRVFLATGIKVAGTLWGVLVLDTTDSAQLPKNTQHKKHSAILAFAATSLEQLVS